MWRQAWPPALDRLLRSCGQFQHGARTSASCRFWNGWLMDLPPLAPCCWRRPTGSTRNWRRWARPYASQVRRSRWRLLPPAVELDEANSNSPARPLHAHSFGRAHGALGPQELIRARFGELRSCRRTQSRPLVLPLQATLGRWSHRRRPLRTSMRLSRTMRCHRCSRTRQTGRPFLTPRRLHRFLPPSRKRHPSRQSSPLARPTRLKDDVMNQCHQRTVRPLPRRLRQLRHRLMRLLLRRPDPCFRRPPPRLLRSPLRGPPPTCRASANQPMLPRPLPTPLRACHLRCRLAQCSVSRADCYMTSPVGS